MEYDVFLSYPHKDAEEVLRIVEALQTTGLNIWIDKSEIRDYESITRSIVEGLARSKVILSYYSSSYAHSRACQWELTAAFLAAQREGDPRKRVLIINPEGRAEHIHPVELRDELFQKDPADAEALKNLALSIKTHASGIKSAIGEIYALTQPRWYGKKGVGSNRFVGRLPDMWKIHSALHASGVPIITGAVASPVVQVQGMGGVGKSLLAEEYALRYAAAFTGGVFWLRAFGNDDAKARMGPVEREAERIRQVIDIAITCGIPVKDRSPAEIEAQLTSEFERSGKPFLWVIDDLPSGMDVETLQKWLAPHPLGRTLITTRTREYNSLGKLVPLGVLESEEAYELLSSWRKPEGKDEEDAARMLIEDLGRHALAVDIAGAALHASEGLQSFAEFRDDLASPTSDELELAGELTGTLPTGHEKSIVSTLLRSIERLGSEGWDFLRLASVLAVAPIPASLISEVFSEVDNIDESSGKKKALHAISQAEKLSLAERTEDEPGARSVHTLISRTVRFKDPMPERSDKLRAAAIAALITELSVINDGRIHRELRLVVTHARELIIRDEDLPTVNLMGWVARYDHIQGTYKSGETLLQRECNIRSHLLGDEHPNTLNSMNNLAVTLRNQGDLEGARKLHEKVLEIQRRVLGDEHPDTLNSMNNLAETLRAQGDLTGARKLHEKVLEILRRMLGDEHPDTLNSMNNLAETLRAQGDLAGARKLHEKALEIQYRVLGDEHPNTLKSMNNHALTLRDQGDLAGARKLHEKVLEIRRKVLGDEHPDTLISMNNLAEVFRTQGDLTGARKLHEKALEIHRRMLGDEHPNTLTIMSNLAETLSDQGDLTGARKLHKKALEIRRKVLGNEHPDTLTSMNNLAETLRKQGDLEGARKLHEKVLEILWRILGDEHLNTLTTMNNLAETLRAQGDLEGARKLHEKVLEIRRKVLGNEHPDTLTSMNNLATTLNDLGNLEGARQLHEKVLEIQRRVLGEEHPDTSLSAWNLVVTHLQVGDTIGATDILKTDLLWLLNRDPASLEANQQKIRDNIIQAIGGKDRPE